MEQDDFGILRGSLPEEVSAKKGLSQLLKNSPIPDEELPDNLGLYLPRQNFARILFMHEIYSQILEVHGVVMEFGVRWGQNMSLFSNLRAIYEPFNYNRRVIGFDTFSGFPQVSPQDLPSRNDLKPGDYGLPVEWKQYLEDILGFHENNAPLGHKRKIELIEGDATSTVPQYLEDSPEAIIALAYFDFDLYMPTKEVLEAIIPRLTKGSVLAFDELNVPEFPGETLALRETLGLGTYAIRRSPISPLTSYLVIE